MNWGVRRRPFVHIEIEIGLDGGEVTLRLRAGPVRRDVRIDVVVGRIDTSEPTIDDGHPAPRPA